MVRVPNVAEVHPSLPIKSIPELIAYAKANPDKLSYASAGIGTPSHLAGQLFNTMTGVNLRHIPYRGDGPAMADLVAGQVPVAFATMIAYAGTYTFTGDKVTHHVEASWMPNQTGTDLAISLRTDRLQNAGSYGGVFTVKAQS